jgi:hypothetical protein
MSGCPTQVYCLCDYDGTPRTKGYTNRWSLPRTADLENWTLRRYWKPWPNPTAIMCRPFSIRCYIALHTIQRKCCPFDTVWGLAQTLIENNIILQYHNIKLLRSPPYIGPSFALYMRCSRLRVDRESRVTNRELVPDSGQRDASDVPGHAWRGLSPSAPSARK